MHSFEASVLYKNLSFGTQPTYNGNKTKGLHELGWCRVAN
jgi:hypothetical protein